MAIAQGTFGQTLRGNEFTATIAFTVAAGSDRVLILGVFTKPGDSITTVTYGGVTMTQVMALTADSPDGPCYLYRLVAPSTGANNFVVDFAGSQANRTYVYGTYTGVDQTTPIDNSASESSVSAVTTFSKSLTPTVADCWVTAVVFKAYTGGSGLTAGSGTTIRVAESNGVLAIADNNAAINPAASTTLTTTNSSAIIAYLMVSLKPVSTTVFIAAPPRITRQAVKRAAYY